MFLFVAFHFLWTNKFFCAWVCTDGMMTLTVYLNNWLNFMLLMQVIWEPVKANSARAVSKQHKTGRVGATRQPMGVWLSPQETDPFRQKQVFATGKAVYAPLPLTVHVVVRSRTDTGDRNNRFHSILKPWICQEPALSSFAFDNMFVTLCCQFSTVFFPSVFFQLWLYLWQ